MSSYQKEVIKLLLQQLQDEADFNRESLRNEQYAQGIEYCIQKIQEIIDSI